MSWQHFDFIQVPTDPGSQVLRNEAFLTCASIVSGRTHEPDAEDSKVDENKVK